MKVLVLALVVGCSWGTITPEEFAKEFGMEPREGAKPEVNVFSASGMQRCVTKLQAAVGEADIHATALSFYPTYVSLTARSPKDRSNVDAYQCRYGEVEQPKPVKLTTSATKTLDQSTFRFSELDLDGLPARLDRTVKELAIEGGKLSDVSVEKMPSGVEVSVRVEGPRKNGSIEYDGRGHELGRNGTKIVPPGPIIIVSTPIDTTAVQRMAVAMSGSITAFDPYASLDRAKTMATAWRRDAILFNFHVDSVANSGLVDLSRTRVEYRFLSPECTPNDLDALAGSPCGIAITLDALHDLLRVRISATPVDKMQPIHAIDCTLSRAIAAVPTNSATFGVDLGFVRSRLTWTFTGAAGKVGAVDATTCALVAK